jgi:hypothetical protein
MVLQLRDGTVVYQGREMDVYDLRERANGPLVEHAEPTFLHRLSDSPAYKEGAAKAVLFPILQLTPQRGGVNTFYLLTPHSYNQAPDLIPL